MNCSQLDACYVMYLNVCQGPLKLLSLSLGANAGTDRFRVDVEVFCARPRQTVDEHAVVAAVAVTGADRSHHQRRCRALRHVEILVALPTKCVTSLKHVDETLCTCTCKSGLKIEHAQRQSQRRRTAGSNCGMLSLMSSTITRKVAAALRTSGGAVNACTWKLTSR